MLTPAAYESYVEALVCQLDFTNNATIYRNQKFPGIRQSGTYEIDVAVKTHLSDTIEFFLIVECKRWSRPVDRPVIQKLIQTKDALAAHKAAVASPVGFTREAISVAQENGVALWVISEPKWEIVKPFMGSQFNVLDAKNFQAASPPRPVVTLNEFEQSNNKRLIQFAYAQLQGNAKSLDPLCQYSHLCVDGTYGDNIIGMDSRLAQSEILSDFQEATR